MKTEPDYMSRWRTASEYDQQMQTREWAYKIPYIKFDQEWEVKAVPPFTGAVIRYFIQKGEQMVSIYLDCYDMLGIYGEPYWELHPYEGDCYRCAMNDTDELLEAIRYSFNNNEK